MALEFGSIFIVHRHFHILDGIALEGEEFPRTFVVIDGGRSRTATPFSALEVLPDGSAGSCIDDTHSGRVGIIALVHILTFDESPRIEVTAALEVDGTAAGHIQHTGCSARLRGRATTIDRRLLTADTDISRTIDDSSLRQRQTPEGGECRSGTCRGIVHHFRGYHQVIRLIIRDEQRHAGADGISTGTYHTVAYHHDQLRTGRSRRRIGRLQVVEDFVSTLDPECSLAVIGHELGADSHIIREVRLAGTTEGEIVLRHAAVGGGVPSAELVSFRRMGGQHHLAVHRNRGIVRHRLAGVGDIIRTVGRYHESHLDNLDERSVHIQVSMRITTARRTGSDGSGYMLRSAALQRTVGIIPARELIARIGLCPEMISGFRLLPFYLGGSTRCGGLAGLHRFTSLIGTCCRSRGRGTDIYLTRSVRRTLP